jgi:hypothetical protein
MEYKWIEKFGLKVHKEQTVDYVKWDELKKLMKKHKMTKQFNKMFGVQTCLASGPYAWDVEAVLTNIMENRLIGSQLLMD